MKEAFYIEGEGLEQECWTGATRLLVLHPQRDSYEATPTVLADVNSPVFTLTNVGIMSLADP